jgi:hypothetical protein
MIIGPPPKFHEIQDILIVSSRDRSSSGMDAGSSGMAAPGVSVDGEVSLRRTDYTEELIRLLGRDGSGAAG